jgi:5'-3' exonuclease
MSRQILTTREEKSLQHEQTNPYKRRQILTTHADKFLQQRRQILTTQTDNTVQYNRKRNNFLTINLGLHWTQIFSITKY